MSTVPRWEENRAKLAETFKRPTTWVEYCEEVSIDNCTTPDIFATEYPDTDSAAKYFADGKYTGYFRLLPENNCTNFPETCTGYSTLLKYYNSCLRKYCLRKYLCFSPISFLNSN